MNHPSVQKAALEVLEDLKNMSKEEFDKLLDKHMQETNPVPVFDSISMLRES